MPTLSRCWQTSPVYRKEMRVSAPQDQGKGFGAKVEGEADIRDSTPGWSEMVGETA